MRPDQKTELPGSAESAVPSLLHSSAPQVLSSLSWPRSRKEAEDPEHPEPAPSSVTADMDAALDVDKRDGGQVKHAAPRQSFVTSKVVAVVVYVAITVVTLIAHIVSAFVYSQTWTLEQKLFHVATYDIRTEHNSFEAIFAAVLIRFICAGFALAAVLNIELGVPGGWPEPGENSRCRG